MFLSPRLVEVIRSTATTLKSIIAGAPPLHPGLLFLCACKEKVTKKKARPDGATPPETGYLTRRGRHTGHPCPEWRRTMIPHRPPSGSPRSEACLGRAIGDPEYTHLDP